MRAAVAGRPSEAPGDHLERARSKVVPDVPTATEAGFPGLTFDGLVGFYGTRDMPLELRERIAADVRRRWPIR